MSDHIATATRCDGYGRDQRPPLSELSIGEIAAVLDGCSKAIFALSSACNQPRAKDAAVALLDDEVDRLDRLRDALLAELSRRKPDGSSEAELLLKVLTAAAVHREDWPDVARLAALAAGVQQ